MDKEIKAAIFLNNTGVSPYVAASLAVMQATKNELLTASNCNGFTDSPPS